MAKNVIPYIIIRLKVQYFTFLSSKKCELLHFYTHIAKNYDGGHPAPAGRALPNLLMRSEC